MLPDAAFSRTKCARPTIAPMGTICILFVCLTIRMNLPTESAQPWRSLNFVGITSAYSWAWGRDTHCWVIWHLLEKVDNAFPAGRRSWNWRIWFGGVQLKNNTGNERTRPWKVLSRSFSSLCVYWTHKLWDSGMIPWLALVYSTLQSSPRHSTEVGLWNGWWYYNSPFWSLINIPSRSTFWSYPSTSPLTSCPQSSSICEWNSCPKLGIPKSSDASLSEVNLILLHTPRTCVSLKWYNCCDTGWMMGSSSIVWRRKRWALRVLRHLSVADSRLKTFAESISYQPWSARYDSVSSI